MPAIVQVQQVLEYILANPKLFPGPHHNTQSRTSDGLTVLDPLRQLELVWKGLCVYLLEAMREGRGVHIKHFGAFTFESSISSQRANLKNENLPALQLRPCFIPAPELRLHVRRSHEQLSHLVDGCIYQQGIRMSYMNPVPIASGCYLKPEFVQCALDAVFKAVVDLAMRAYNLDLVFEELVTVKILNKCLKFCFSKAIQEQTKVIEKAWPLKSVNGPVSALEAPPNFVENKNGNLVSPVRMQMSAKKPASKLQQLQKPDVVRLKDMKEKIHRISESSKDMHTIALSN